MRKRRRIRNPLPQPPACVCLPSGDAAIDLMRGNDVPINVASVLGTMLVRGSLVATGLLIAGVRGKELVLYTVAATGAVEIGILSWAAYATSKP